MGSHPASEALVDEHETFNFAKRDRYSTGAQMKYSVVLLDIPYQPNVEKWRSQMEKIGCLSSPKIMPLDRLIEFNTKLFGDHSVTTIRYVSFARGYVIDSNFGILESNEGTLSSVVLLLQEEITNHIHKIYQGGKDLLDLLA